MKWILLSVATLSLVCGAVALADSSNTSQISVSEPQILAMQHQSQAQPETKTFIGTIHKSGDQFVLRLDASKESYQLDDQQSASKFAGKKVKVIGVLDASNNTIRVQSIEEANA
jgi:hypothetical protein